MLRNTEGVCHISRKKSVTKVYCSKLLALRGVGGWVGGKFPTKKCCAFHLNGPFHGQFASTTSRNNCAHMWLGGCQQRSVSRLDVIEPPC